MLQVKIIGAPNSWYVQDLQRAAGSRFRVGVQSYDALKAKIQDNIEERDSSAEGGGALILRSMPASSLEQVVFRMDVLAQWEAAGTYMVNPPRAMEVAIDKFLASARLAQAGIPTPRTNVCQSWQTAMEGFAELGEDVVIKPLFGGEGRGITRVSDPDLAERAFKMLTQMGAVIYQQQFVPHEGSDLRILLLGDRAWGMRRRNTDDWRTNVSRGAKTEPFEPDATTLQLARNAAQAVGAVFAGVDILEGNDGTRYVLEVNAVPGWKAISQTLQVDIAAELLEHIGTAVRHGR